MNTPDDEPGPGRKLLLHFINEMSWPLLFPFGFVSFLFFYGVTNSLIKFTGREIASLGWPVGPVIGALSALLLMLVVTVLKLRHRD